MNITITLDLDEVEANIVGEVLRKLFWPPYIQGGYPTLGCYSSFKYAPEVEEISTTKASFDEYVIWHHVRLKIQNEYVNCRWFWDGDGYIEFELPSGRVVYNSDCKHPDNWYDA